MNIIDQKKIQCFINSLVFSFRVFATALISIIFTTIFAGVAVNADIITDRKAGFKKNAASMKIMASDFDNEGVFNTELLDRLTNMIKLYNEIKNK